MGIEDRIIQAEEKWFRTKIESPKYLILSPYSHIELTQAIVEDEDVLDDVYSYEGLVIAISTHPRITDFELA